MLKYAAKARGLLKRQNKVNVTDEVLRELTLKPDSTSSPKWGRRAGESTQTKKGRSHVFLGGRLCEIGGMGELGNK